MRWIHGWSKKALAKLKDSKILEELMAPPFW